MPFGYCALRCWRGSVWDWVCPLAFGHDSSRPIATLPTKIVNGLNRAVAANRMGNETLRMRVRRKALRCSDSLELGKA